MPPLIGDKPLTNVEKTRRARAKKRAEIEAMPKTKCACGCGTEIPPVNTNGRIRRFAAGHNGVPDLVRARPSNWKGGRRNEQGYIYVYVPRAHIASGGRNRYVPEHRVVMSEALGRALNRWETVHHMNGIRSDNRLENLELRQGNHGPGAAYRCCDCGSHRVEPANLKEG